MSIPIHEGQKLKVLVETYTRSKRMTLSAFCKKADIKYVTYIYSIYRKKRVRDERLKPILELMDISVDQFYSSENSDDLSQALESVHHGENLKGILASMGVSILWFAKNMNVTRQTVYNHFEEKELDEGILMKAASILNIPISQLKGFGVGEKNFQKEIYTQLLQMNNKLDRLLINAN